jgi:hypothetical protein
MIFADEEQEVAIRRNSRSQFRQIGIDTGTQVLDFDNRIFLYYIFFLGNEFDGGINRRLCDTDETTKKQ